MEKISTTEDMKTLVSCMNKLTLDGYTGSFKATNKGLYSIDKDRNYQPDDIHIINFFRFEGASDPADNAILYVIETNDGGKGTLTDAYGPYADTEVTKFIKQVEDFEKKQPA